MIKYAVVLLLLVNVSLCHSTCCEKEEVCTNSLLDAAVDLISKAKLNTPSCSGNEVCVQEYFDCADLYRSGYKENGIYSITPMNRIFYKKYVQVYCDMKTDGGGWTVIQRRGNFGRSDDYFYKDWKSYKDGFGSVESDFWLGNDNIFALTNQKPYSIRFDMVKKNKTKQYAKYDSFWIDNEFNNYTLQISGYKGNIGDSMTYHSACPFTTKDKANAWMNGENCAIKFSAGWWYNSCHRVNLNGLYNNATISGIRWNFQNVYNVLVSTEMKIRPANFEMNAASIKLSSFNQDSVDKSSSKTNFF